MGLSSGLVSVTSTGHRAGQKSSWDKLLRVLDTALTYPLFIPIQQLPVCQETSAAQHVWLWGPVPVPPLCPVTTVQLSAIKENLSSPEVKAPQGSGTQGSRGEGRLGSPFLNCVSVAPIPSGSQEEWTPSCMLKAAPLRLAAD